MENGRWKVRSADMKRPGPIPGSYWLVDDVLLAGEYPGASQDHRAREKLVKILDAGIRSFIDLTEASEPLTAYDGMLGSLGAERGIAVKHLRYSIRDAGVPREREQMTRILATIREEIAAGRPVYVHCWGGIGRTGTVAGCWLAEEGLAGPDAIARIAGLRGTTADGWNRSPETEEQRRYICEWRVAEGPD